ncbi:MAG TPA: TlpA disulfide reductase family protein [Caulobacteraceae bacterium]|jgi:peroxiredoxin|nr:TlpA disulfide reductase family protein [Caulobacteraceae bacterium]
MRQILAAALASAFAVSTATAATTGAPAPGCALHLQDGRALALGQLKGKVVYLDFWASWCTSCVLSFPFMSALQESRADKDVMVVGVAMDQQPADAQRFLQRHPARFAIATGDNSQCAVRFGVAAMPSSFVIDRRGVVRAAHQGFRLEDAKVLSGLVDRLADEPAR